MPCPRLSFRHCRVLAYHSGAAGIDITSRLQLTSAQTTIALHPK
ncbi:hypothetical protein [Tychonema sp. LEGE 06208]|nr:hypothetical protein [Tychonema sp. LEGE 06208]